MKKTLLLTIALLLSTITFAQTFVEENFNADLPKGWSTSEVGGTNWKISSTTYSGGDGKELMLAWSPAFEGTTRLISTPFDFSNTYDLNVSFKHFFDNFKDGEFKHTIGIATSSDNGETWNVGWSQEYTITGTYEVKANFSTPDLGKANVMLCLFYNGNSKEMDNWFFDDLLIYEQKNLDIRVVDINIADIIETGEKEIAFTVQNIGLATVESFEAEIKASNWEEAVIATFKQNIANSESVQLTYKDKKFNAFARKSPYTISVKIMSVNGETDQNTSNDYVQKKVSVAFNKAQRIPMIEHFSSSTCGPCVAVNQQMHTLTQNNEGKFTYTKFPTAGDPYNNFEASYKVQEYGVIGVPNLFLDGRSKGSNYITQEMLDEKYNTPAYADIRGAFSIDGDNIYVIADFLSYITLNDVVAYITVNEKTTHNNTGSNGEQEFHHIMMKMLESKTGNKISLNAGEYQRLEFNYNMSLTNVEEIGDLEVALWLQNPITKEIYNSHFAYEYTSHCYPIQNLTLNQNDEEKTLTWEAPENGTPICYSVYINGNLVSENKSDLSYNLNTTDEMFTAEVIAVYKNNMTSVGVAKLFGSEDVEEDENEEGNEEDNEEDNEEETPVTVETPTNLSAYPTVSTVSLTWNHAENAESYNIYRNNTLIENIDRVNYIDEGLEPNTEYCYTVTAVLKDIESGHSNEVCVKTLPSEGIEEQTSSLLLYPNPANDRLYIEAEAEIEEAVVYSITGVIVSQQSTVNGQQSLSIDASNLNAGIYFIKINTKQGNIVKRFIKN